MHNGNVPPGMVSRDRLVRSLPDQLHHRVKVFAALHNMTLADAYAALLEDGLTRAGITASKLPRAAKTP